MVVQAFDTTTSTWQEVDLGTWAAQPLGDPFQDLRKPAAASPHPEAQHKLQLTTMQGSSIYYLKPGRWEGFQHSISTHPSIEGRSWQG